MTPPTTTTTPLPRNTILAGDALTRLRELPTGSVDSVVTSPPYFRLRDYGHADQIGLESSVDRWVEQLRHVMGEVHRVLVPTGTVWLNLGDTYSLRPRDGSPRKSLLLGPERLALALIADGWTIRNKIVWAKTNTVPSSVMDRLSTKHEVIYLLAKQPKYFFDLHQIREPHKSRPPKRKPRVTRPGKYTKTSDWLGPNGDSDLGLAAMKAAGIIGHPLGKNPGDVWSFRTGAYKGAHFATYPEALIRRIIEAGTPRIRCAVCRLPWIRKLVRNDQKASRLPPRPTCNHGLEDAEPGIVLDPFIGAGTTAIPAAKLGRDWLGIELNPDYIDLATQRITDALTASKNSNSKKERR